MSRVTYKQAFKSDIFNQDNSFRKKERFQKKYHNLSASDVFNEIEAKNFEEIKGNNSQSLNKRQNIIKTNERSITPIERVYISDYNPNNYLKCEPAFKHKMKDIYEINDESLKNIKTTKGYLAKDEYERNLPIRKPNEYKEGYRRIKKKGDIRLSHSAYLEDESINNKENVNEIVKGSKIDFLKSNIFFDKDKNKKNHKVTQNKQNRREEEECKLQYTQPKPIQREQWHSKLDWRKGETELVLSSYYKSKANSYRRARSAFNRKMNDMKGNDIFNTNANSDIINNSHRGNESTKQQSKLNYQSVNNKEPKAFKNTSCQFNDDNFYDKALKLRNVKEEHKPDHKYTIQHKGNLHISELKQAFHEKGLKVYEISTLESSIIRDDSHSIYSFKVKGNNIELFNKKIKEIENKLSNEKGVKIEPQKYICVNKRDNSKTKERDDRKGLFKSNNDKNSIFTKRYDSINHQYKKR